MSAMTEDEMRRREAEVAMLQPQRPAPQPSMPGNFGQGQPGRTQAARDQQVERLANGNLRAKSSSVIIKEQGDRIKELETLVIERERILVKLDEIVSDNELKGEQTQDSMFVNKLFRGLISLRTSLKEDELSSKVPSATVNKIRERLDNI